MHEGAFPPWGTKEVTKMKKFFATGIFFLALLSFTALFYGNSFAAEVEGVEGVTYLTFLNRSPYLDQFSFEEGGNAFHMAVLEKDIEGQGRPWSTFHRRVDERR
jgi:hypothetical protein